MKRIDLYQPYISFVDFETKHLGTMSISSNSGLTPQEARNYAYEIIEAANKLEKINNDFIEANKK